MAGLVVIILILVAILVFIILQPKSSVLTINGQTVYRHQTEKAVCFTLADDTIISCQDR